MSKYKSSDNVWNNGNGTYRSFLQTLQDGLAGYGIDTHDYFDSEYSSLYQTSSARAENSSGMTNADIQAFLANQYSAAQDRAFQERMANTQWQRGVQDMQAAGVNPALAYGQGGNAAPSGAQAASAQATQYNNGPAYMQMLLGVMKEMSEVMKVPMEMMETKASIANMYAQNENLRQQNILLHSQTRKTDAEARSVEIGNEFKPSKEAGEVRNIQLTADNIIAQKDDIVASMELKQAQAQTEAEKQLLTQWQSAVQKANKEQIEALTPELVRYQQAATLNQKNQAAKAAADTAMQEGLLDAGYVQKTLDKLEAEIQQHKSSADYQEAMKLLTEWKTAVRTGKALPNDPDWDNMIWSEIPAEGCMWLLRGAYNGIVQGVSGLSEAGLGSISLK